MDENISLRFLRNENRDFKNVLVWPGPHTHLETNFDADKVFEMTHLMLVLLVFQIPEARTQTIFTDSQLNIWAVEGRQECFSSR